MTDNIANYSNSIASNEGLPICYDIYHPEGQSPESLPTILFLHGFKGFKDWGTFPAICSRLAKKGFAVVAINFSLNGIGEDPMEFDRLELFARETLSQDLDDVGTIIEGIKNEEITAGGTPLNADSMGVLGHSRGGQTAIAAAAEYEAIHCLVTWSAVADYNARWSEEMKADWREKGVTDIKNGRTGQIMPMNKIVWDDARENADRVIAIHRVGELSAPSLFIHSKDDEAVDYSNAEKLYAACSASEKELMLLESTGHTFGGSHPFEDAELPEPLQVAFDASAAWFVRYLKR